MLAAAGFTGWWISLRFWPYTACKRCNGTGRNGGSNRSRWGVCRRCNGSGKRERLAHRMLNRRKN